MENYLDQIKNIFLKSGKNKIVIIGKGDSVKEINLEKMNDFFIINLNDSENIIAGDIVLFYRIDLYEKIRKNGFKAGYYITPAFFKIPESKHIEVKHNPSSQDSFESMYEYFQSDQFHLVDFLILSALKLSILFQKEIKENVEVFFLGFDFYSENVRPDDNEMYDLEYKNIILKTQESFFKNLFSNFQSIYADVEIKHVGEKNYSSLSTSSFNEILLGNRLTTLKKFKSNSELYFDLMEEIKTSSKVIIVAEFTNNHIGDPVRLLEMIRLAKESGADMIKVQKRDVDTFYTDQELARPYGSPFGKLLGDYRRGVELTSELFELLDFECRKYEIPWFASALDWKSYQYLLQFDTPIIKLPSTISNHKNYLLKVAEDFDGDLVISTGFTDAEYENFVLNNFLEKRNLFLLQCTSSYPTPPEACQVAVVRHYNELSETKFKNLFSGYSSHDIGSMGCMLSVAAGARMIEKHVKLGDLEWIHFDGVAVNLLNNKFKDFVHDIRKAEIMCGSKNKLVHLSESHKYTPNILHN